MGVLVWSGYCGCMMLWSVHFHCFFVCLYCVMLMLVHVLWTQIGVSLSYSEDVCLPVICLLHRLQFHTGPGSDSMFPARSVMLMCILLQVSLVIVLLVVNLWQCSSSLPNGQS